jgi:hypothetical protein
VVLNALAEFARIDWQSVDASRRARASASRFVVRAFTFADMSEHNIENSTVIVTYRAPPALAAALDRAAAAEGITRSDVARRAALRDLQRAGLYPAAPAAA